MNISQAEDYATALDENPKTQKPSREWENGNLCDN